MKEKSDPHTNTQKRATRILKILAGALLTIIVLTFILLPTLIGTTLESHLESNGYTETSIGNIDLNLLTGHFALEALHATADAPRSISIDKLELDFSPLALFGKTLKINRITITGPHIRLQQQADGSISAGYQPAPKVQTESAEIPEQQTEWQMSLRELAIHDLQLKLQNSDNSASLTSSFDFRLEQLLTDTGGTASIEHIAMRNYRFLAQDVPALEYAELSISRIQASPTTLEIGAIHLKDVTATVQRLANGELLSVSTAGRFTPVNPPVTDEPEPPQSNEPVQFSLGQFILSGNNRIRLKDESIAPKLDIDFTIQELEIGAVNNADPELNTPVTFRMIRDKYDAISLTGTVAAFAQSPQANLDFTIKDFDITPFSPYVVNAIGYRTKTGQLNLENKIIVNNNQITSNNKIRLHRFTVEISDPEKAKKFEDEIKLSLESALYFIRDDNDNIELEIPINGKLDDPQFEIGPIVRQAMGKALQGASLTYLTYALQPWGALYMIGKKIGGNNGTVQLEPIVFSAGDAALSGDMQNYLAKIAGLLAKKEKLQLNICPISTVDDAQLLNSNAQQPLTDNVPLQTLDALSNQRAESVKTFFVEQHAIAPDRLYKCTPHHETGKKIKPQVALSF